MTRLANRILTTFTLGCALASGSPALAGGPPVLAVALPDAQAKGVPEGAVLVVHASQCGTPLDAKIEARAEGVVAGERRSVPVTLRAGHQRGTHYVTGGWPAQGRWLLVLTVENHGTAVTVVELDAQGRPRLGDDRAVAARSYSRRLAGGDLDALLAPPRS